MRGDSNKTYVMFKGQVNKGSMIASYKLHIKVYICCIFITV